jgi:hypothetical protein
MSVSRWIYSFNNLGPGKSWLYWYGNVPESLGSGTEIEKLEI